VIVAQDLLPSAVAELDLEHARALATDTGGRPFFPSSPADLEHISEEIINDIRTQYIIGYVPTGTDRNKSFHKIDVSIANDPQRQKSIAVTRLGYSTIKK